MKKPEEVDSPVFEWGVIRETKVTEKIGLKGKNGHMFNVALDRPVKLFQGEHVQVTIRVSEGGDKPTSSKIVRFIRKHIVADEPKSPVIEIEFRIWTPAGKQKVHYRYGKIGEGA